MSKTPNLYGHEDIPGGCAILVVTADPTIRIRSTVELMRCMTRIDTVSPALDAFDVTYRDDYKDYPGGTYTLTSDGLILWEDDNGQTHTADELSCLWSDGSLTAAPVERVAPVVLGDLAWAKRLLAAVKPALDAWVFDPEGDLNAREYQAQYSALEVAKAEAEKVIGE